MLDQFEVLKTLHVLGAVIWVGGAATLQVFAIRTLSSGDETRLVETGPIFEWIGTRIFTPASLIVLAMGIWMVIDRPDIGFGDEWILIGLAGITFSALVGSLFLGPETGRIAKLIEQHGPANEEVQRRMRRIFLVSRIELVILLIVVIDMVVRPGAPF
ncbi:MAG: DUF2269 domain-containing protein [Actinomycetota bacterium]|nr:DUF2269 domain-containing protein [Actinomycetota bacterium]